MDILQLKKMSAPHISIVATLYNSQKFIEEFVNRIDKCVDQLNVTHEIIFVDDGSKDESVKIAEQLAYQKSYLKLFKFSKNFGHHKAMYCGLTKAKGEYVFLIDVDLEEQPELLIEFYNRISQTDDDLIFGIQQSRNKDKVFGTLFWKLLGLITPLSFGNNPCTVRIMKKQVVNELKKFEQRDFFIGELFSHIGMKQSTIPVKKNFKGESSYSFIKKYSMFFNMLITNTNDLWIKLSLVSLVISILSFVLGATLIISYLLGKNYLSGWLSIMVVISFFSSFTFLFFGITLQFLSKVLDEVRAKPRYIIKNDGE